MASHVQGTTSVRGERTRTPSRLVTETKHALKTTEFWAFILAVAGVLIAAQIVTSGNGSGGGADSNGDAFNASRAWLYVTILTVGYMVSRGFAKAGSHEPYWDGGENEDRR
jgi:hypothetical protein